MNQLNSHNFEDVYKILNIDINKLGCIMLDLEGIIKPPDDIAYYYSKDKFWINGWVAENNAHITLLYGLIESGRKNSDLVDKVLQGWRYPIIEIESIGYFDSPIPEEHYYCIVAHIKLSDQLMEGHQRLEFLPHVNTFTGYKPHMTICYIDKSKGEEYRDILISLLNSFLINTTINVQRLNYGK